MPGTCSCIIVACVGECISHEGLLTFVVEAAAQDLQGLRSRSNNLALHCTPPFWPHCRPVATHLLHRNIQNDEAHHLQNHWNLFHI